MPRSGDTLVRPRTGDQELSQEQMLALLPPEEQERLLTDLDIEELVWDWAFRARPSQYIDPNDTEFVVTVLGAGRGSGKTLSGSNWIKDLDRLPEADRVARTGGAPLRFSLVARTAADVRDVMINGESGLMNIYPPSQRDLVEWTPSRRELILPNGAIGLTFSAEEPDQLRGPQSHATWGDELAAWKEKPGVDGLTAWDNVRIGTRLGPCPQIVATTTPKRTPAIRKLWAESADPTKHVVLRRMKTRDNVFLSETYLGILEGLWGGTTLGQQELDGLLLDDVEGALLAISVLDRWRVSTLPSTAIQGVVAVDPSAADKPRDECGIIVLRATTEPNPLMRHGYVVEDASLRGSPGAWGKQVVRTAHAHRLPNGLLPTVVVEGNQGQAMVRSVLKEAATELDLAVPHVSLVSASASKRARAEPVVAAYERGRLHHVENHADLEDQLTTWTADAGYSPDRADALVHGASALLLPQTLTGGLSGGTTLHAAQVRNASIPTKPSPRLGGRAGGSLATLPTGSWAAGGR